MKKNLNNEKIANYLIGSIALAKIPSLEASQYLEEIAESSPSLYKSASLTLGVLANKLSNTDRVESLKILDKRISNIKGLTDKNRLAVEFSAIGNMGLIESQKFLESYLAKSDSNMTSIILKSMRRNPDSRVNEIYLKTLSNSASEYLKENISFYLKQRSIANNGLNDLKDLIDAESNFNTKRNLIGAYVNNSSKKDAKIFLEDLKTRSKEANLKTWIDQKLSKEYVVSNGKDDKMKHSHDHDHDHSHHITLQTTIITIMT